MSEKTEDWEQRNRRAEERNNQALELDRERTAHLVADTKSLHEFRQRELSLREREAEAHRREMRLASRMMLVGRLIQAKPSADDAVEAALAIEARLSENLP